MKRIYLLIILLFCISLAQSQARTLNTNDAVGTLPGVFNVNTNGAATYYIPLRLPKGKTGFTPSLGLKYNSQTNNGILGMGWSLAGISAISRVKPDMYHDGFIASVNFDNNDKFSLDGQRLITVNNSLTDYRTEKDSFSKIIAHGTNVHNPDWFEVRTKDGRIIEYGRDENSNNSAMTT